MPLTENPRRWDVRVALQAIMVALGLCGIGGAAVGSYVATATRLTEYDLRLTTLEHAREDDRKANSSYQEEMRAAVARAVDILTDVRLQIARGVGHAK